ncbi:hypothetical protein [Microlunatus phosphovorus]|nr:hypothetical protein [Microlunatus phosphovorus]
MTSDPRMTAILEELAAGRIDAGEAARRIDALKTPSSPGSPVEGPQDSGAEPTNEELAAAGEADPWAVATDRPQHATYTTESFTAPTGESPTESPKTKPANSRGPADKGAGGNNGVERITVRAIGRRVRIVGESAVATLAADGPHVIRRNGSVLEVSSDGEVGASIDGFSIFKAPRNLDEFRSLGLGKELFLRVNPAIEVDVEVTGGSLNTERVPHLGKVRLTAGAAKLLDVEEIHDALIQAGQATIKGTITHGRSRVRAESGSLSVQLADASNVTVHGEAQLGKVSWSGGHTGAGDEVVMGNGSARLDIEVVMGHAAVKVGSDPAAEDLR